MRYLVQGQSLVTGKHVRLKIEAESPEEAVARVSDVVEVSGEPAPVQFMGGPLSIVALSLVGLVLATTFAFQVLEPDGVDYLDPVEVNRACLRFGKLVYATEESSDSLLARANGDIRDGRPVLALRVVDEWTELSVSERNEAAGHWWGLWLMAVGLEPSGTSMVISLPDGQLAGGFSASRGVWVDEHRPRRYRVPR